MDFLRDLVQQAPGFVIVLLDRDHRFYMVNNAFMKLVGDRDLIGRTVADAMPEIPRQGFTALLDHVWETKEAFHGESLPVLIERPDAQEPDLRYVDFIHQPIKNNRDEVMGIYVQGIDITERKSFENKLHILAHESAHRVKNILAMVNAIVTLTLRSQKDKESAIAAVSARLQAISAAQTTLLDGGTSLQSDLESLIKNALAVAVDTFGNITISGPKTNISEKAGLPLALIFHELMTNAIKYGALLKSTGKISITWFKDDDDMIHIHWSEIGTVNSAPPEKKGFGSALIQRGLSFDKRNKVDVNYNEQGVSCVIQLAAAL
ncbi:sensor histidine kinase [Bartonella tamiae]|uniref:sensor histidine kinase n=1 Tax=Bartonella tamiae TaxID=373638 RepID=UPI0024737DDA|nr:HWE histidine kinase domain-containing protein [Bartonella tamiae]